MKSVYEKEHSVPNLVQGSEDSSLLLRSFYDYLTKTRGLEPQEALNCANDLCRGFTNSLSLATTSYNLFDGMGDFISHVFFILKLMDVYKESPNVSMQHFCFVERKQVKNAESFLDARFDKQSFATFSLDSAPNLDDIANKKVIIIEYETIKKSDSIHPEAKKYLQSKFPEVDFLFNFSLPFSDISPMVGLTSPLKVVESWLEYGLAGNKKNETQNTMGVSEEHLGIRIFDDIVSLVQKPIDECVRNLHSIENKELLSILTGKKNPSLDDITEWVNNDSLAFGYVKNKANFKGLLYLSAAMKSSGDTSVIVDTDLINLESTTFWADLQKLGYTQVELYDSQGNKKIRQLGAAISQTDASLPPSDQLPQKRVLKLIPLKGICHSDKIKLMTSRNLCVNAASGDTSISELISTGCSGDNEPAFPFIQKIFNPMGESFKYSFHNNILFECKAFASENPQFKEGIGKLEGYLYLLLIEKIPQEALGLGFAQSVLKDKESILGAWKAFCNHLAQKRNIEKSFQEQLILFTMLQLVQSNRINELVDLSCKMGQLKFHGQSFLHYALKLQKEDLFTILFKEYLPNPLYSKIKEQLTVAFLDDLIDTAIVQLRKSEHAREDTFKILNTLINYYVHELKADIPSKIVRELGSYNKNPVNPSLFPSLIMQNPVHVQSLLLQSFSERRAEDFDKIIKGFPDCNDAFILKMFDSILASPDKAVCPPFLLVLLNNLSDNKKRLAMYEKILFEYAAKNQLNHNDTFILKMFDSILANPDKAACQSFLLVLLNNLSDDKARLAMSEKILFEYTAENKLGELAPQILKQARENPILQKSMIDGLMNYYSKNQASVEMISKDKITLYFNELLKNITNPELKDSLLQLKDMVLQTHVNLIKKSENFDEIRNNLVTQIAAYLNKVSSPTAVDSKLFSKPILNNKETNEIQTLIKELSGCADLEEIKDKLKPFGSSNNSDFKAIISNFETQYLSETRKNILL